MNPHLPLATLATLATDSKKDPGQRLHNHLAAKQRLVKNRMARKSRKAQRGSR